MASCQVYIDGTEVTTSVLEGTSTHTLNQPWQATFRMPIEEAIGDVGSKVKIYFDGLFHFHGHVMNIEDDCDENVGYTRYVCLDPMELWAWRPARDPVPDSNGNYGNFSDPTFLQLYETGPLIMEAILAASESPGLVPLKAEGPLFLEFGSFPGGGRNISGGLQNFPMTIMEVANAMTSTGACDIVLTPIDDGVNMARVDCYNGNYGTRRDASVVFQYGLGAYNIRNIRRSRSIENMVNKLYYFLGPRMDVGHWPANIQGDDPCLERMMGEPNDDPPRGITWAEFLSMRTASQAQYGVRMNIQMFDTDLIGRATKGSDPCLDPAKYLYRKQWLIEQYLRMQPRQLVYITPVRGTPVGTFDIGDSIGVEAASYVRGGFSGAQRVYGYTATWDAEGVVDLGQIVVSDNQG
jgi:hypothetical protein